MLWDLNVAIWKEIICLLSFLQLTIFLLDYIQSTRSGSRIKRKLICHRCRCWKEFDLNIWWDLNVTILCLFKEQIFWHKSCDISTSSICKFKLPAGLFLKSQYFYYFWILFCRREAAGAVQCLLIVCQGKIGPGTRGRQAWISLIRFYYF